MLINDNYPQASVYYISYLIIKELKNNSSYFDIYYNVKSKIDISLRLYNLSLDYLFMINKVIIEKNGELRCL